MNDCISCGKSSLLLTSDQQEHLLLLSGVEDPWTGHSSWTHSSGGCGGISLISSRGVGGISYTHTHTLTHKHTHTHTHIHAGTQTHTHTHTHSHTHTHTQTHTHTHTDTK